MHPINYKFQFADGSVESVSVSNTNDMAPGEYPKWTELGFHQCPNCPLSSDTRPHCPMAVQFMKLVPIIDKRLSYDLVTVQVDMQERSITKTTSLQRAIGSLMGLLSASSECPRVSFLKPMGYFHLPFSNEEESIYRVASMYLLTQYFLVRENKIPDWKLETLKTNYKELQIVNMAMAERLRTINPGDGVVNALIILDLLAKALPYSIDEALDELLPIFENNLSDVNEL